MKELRGLKELLMIYFRAMPNASEEGLHLDEDIINALLENRLSRREKKPIIDHLVKCDFCRHLTAEIVKLDSVLSEEGLLEYQESHRLSQKVSDLVFSLFQKPLASIEAFEEKQKTEDKKDES